MKILSYLFSVWIGLPFCDTILLCHVATLWHHLFVVPYLRRLIAVLHREVLWNGDTRLVRSALHPHLTLRIGHNVTLNFCDVIAYLSHVNKCMFRCLLHLWITILWKSAIIITPFRLNSPEKWKKKFNQTRI